MRIVLIAVVLAAGCGDKKDAGAGSGSAAGSAVTGSGSAASSAVTGSGSAVTGSGAPATGSAAARSTKPADLPASSAPGTPEVLAKFDAACDGGYGAACFDAGMRRAKGMGTARNRVAGVAWLEKGCRLDDAESCGLLAGFIGTGDEGVPMDVKRAVDLHTKLCPRQPASCTVLASYYGRGEVVAKDEAKAMQLLQQGCEAGDGRGCEDLANRLANGDGIAKDQKRAFEIAKKACDADAYNCETLGAFYIGGTGVTKDTPTGVTYVEKACKAGSKKACEGVDVLNGR